MTDNAKRQEVPPRPSGANLDRLVLWAIRHIQEGPRYSPDIRFYVARKAGREWEHDLVNFGLAISRSLDRLKDAGVVVYEDPEGYMFGPEEPS